jgi:chromosome segregation ATPase
VQRLIKAGEALEKAQREAISGDAVGFDTARRDEAAAIHRLRDAAAERLPSASTAMLDRVAKTLTAAAVSSEGRALLKQGRLTEDLEPPGFEALAGVVAAPRTARKRAARPARPTRREETLRRRKEEADEKAEQTADEAGELERAAREAEQAAKKARRAAEAARKRATAAAEQAERLEAELTELEES